MKIAHVTATFPPYQAGTGLVCYQNALGLARRGHDVTVFTAKTPESVVEPAELQVCRLPVCFRIGNAPLLPGLTQIADFDLIHLHHPFIFGSELVWAVAGLRGIPYLLTHHNDLIGEGLRRPVFNAYAALSRRPVFGAARRIGVVSLDHARHSSLAPILRDRPSDVVEIPNGVDTDIFQPDGEIVDRAELRIKADVRTILFVGALDRAHHFKGLGYLLRALRDLDDQSAVLVIIGDGDFRASCERQARQLGVDDRTRFIGAVANENLPRYYRFADVVVLPSFPPESFGLVLIEAMACGRPAIAHNIPGVRSVVADGKSGLLARAGDVGDLAGKIDVILADPHLGQSLGECGRARVLNTYALDRIIPRLEAIYRDVLHIRAGSALTSTSSAR